MKALVLAALLIALTGSAAAASYKSSPELNSGELTLNIERNKISYTGFDNLSADQFSLPVRQYTIRLEKNSSISAISAETGEIEIIESLSDSTFIRSDIATSIEEETGFLPETFSLYQNYPNPFNPSTTISFDLPSKSSVTLSIFNITGRKVATIVERQLPSGHHKFEWNGLDYSGHETASGIYFYKLESENFRAVKKMILLR